MRISITNLCRSYGKTKALDDVSFEIPSGSVYGFIGPNGAGKSTALRIMAAGESPDSGGIFYDGISVIDYPDKVRPQIGYMPDSLPGNRFVQVWEYLDFAARAFNLRGQERLNKLKELEKFAQLTDIWQKRFNDLSKGMKQRVSLARMLVNDPPVLLLDEPTAGLDPRARIELIQKLQQLNQQGKTIFIASHILSDLEDFCEGAVIIEKGKLTFAGKLSDLAEKRAGSLVMLRFSVPVDNAITETLESCPDISSITKLYPNQLLLEINGGDDELAKVMIEIHSRRLPAKSYERCDCGLEEIFLKTTVGEIQ